jgi:hypothetical protein
VFKQIAEAAANYLNIRPDRGEASPVATTVAPPLESRASKTLAVRSQ